MVTLYRTLKLWQLRTKWRLAMWQYIDTQATEIIKNPKEFENNLVSAFMETLHNSHENGGAT